MGDFVHSAEILTQFTIDSAWSDFRQVCETLGLRGEDFEYHRESHLVKRFRDYPADEYLV